MMTQKGDLYIKLVYWILSPLDILCINPEKNFDNKNNDYHSLIVYAEVINFNN